MKIDFKGILEGAWNSIFVKKAIEDTAEERMSICRQCDYNSDNAKKNRAYRTIRQDLHCVQCGCDLHLKTRCLSCECPLKKWDKFVTQEEEYKITTKLKDDSN